VNQALKSLLMSYYVDQILYPLPKSFLHSGLSGELDGHAYSHSKVAVGFDSGFWQTQVWDLNVKSTCQAAHLMIHLLSQYQLISKENE
jgi:hypothetical protein